MDLKFDSKAAVKLIKYMDKYYDDMAKEIKRIIALADRSNTWNDDQNTAFISNINEIVNDLKDTIKIQGEYRNIYSDRVKELRE